MKKVVWRHVKIIIQAGKNWAADKAFQHSAALSFYMLFSMAPLLIIAITITGVIFGEEAAQGQLFDTLSQWMGEEGAETLEAAIAETHPKESGWFSTIMGFALLGVGATTVFAQLQRSLNDIWKVTPNPQRSGILVFIKTRVLSLTLVLSIGFLLLVSLMMTAILSATIRFANDYVPLPGIALQLTDIVVSFFFITFLFAAIFKVLPDVRLPWRMAMFGSVITAGLFILGKYLISIYITHTGAGSAYGAAGSLVAILIWINYSGLILFFGAEITRAYAEDRGIKIEPKSTAVRTRTTIIDPTELENRTV